MNQQRLDVDQAPDLTEQIAELERELKTRRRVYSRWIEEDRIKPDVAHHRIACLEAALYTLRQRQHEEAGKG